jgi:type I restriction enzyme S subunit
MTKKYKTYPEYKDSGVEWLGKIPEDWSVKKLKFICNVETGSKNTEDSIDDGLYPFFVRSQTIEKINSVGADCEAVLTAGDGVGVGKVFHYYNGKFDFHQRVYMLSQFSQVLGRFVYYYLSNNFYKVALEGNAKSTVDSLRMPQFLNFEFSLPCIDVQEKIVSFLDHETAKIDLLINKQKKLIELLKEKRQAVISHAVTKGLNPNVPMRDSGIEWLGEIPEGWSSSKVKYLTLLVNRGMSPDYSEEETELPIINQASLGWNYFDRSKFKYHNPNSALYRERWVTDTGDILINSTGTGTVGRAAIVTNREKNIFFDSHITRIRLDINKCHYNFIYYQFVSKEFQNQMILFMVSGSTNQIELSRNDLREYQLFCPPLTEQIQISDFLDNETAKIDLLIDKTNKAIELAQERRAALISAAVTGKIDVRDWQEKKTVSSINKKSTRERCYESTLA